MLPVTSVHHNDVILLVTNASQDWLAVVAVLMEQGYQVETAAGGVVALSMLDNQDVDLLIIDGVLNDLSSPEVIRIVRYVYPASRLPILLTREGVETGKNEGIGKSEINGIIEKPLDIEDLTARVSRVLKSRHDDIVAISEQQELPSTQIERLTLINKALKKEIRKRIRNEQHLRKAMERRLNSDPNCILDDSLTSPPSENASTGLISWGLFENRLVQLINGAENDIARHVLCYLQATNLEKFQECYGETARDGLLRHLTKVLHSCMRKDDLITELGGGEFLILLQHCPVAQAQRLVSALCGKTRGYRFIWHNKELKVDLLTGITPISGSDINTLIEAAKREVTQAAPAKIVKKAVPGKPDSSKIVVETGSAEYLLEAMRNGRFQLYFQPIEALSRGANPNNVRFELFLRLQDEFGRFIRPAAFLPAIERHELVSNLDRWIISTAFSWLAGHMTSRFERLALCCINLSAQSLSDGTLREFIRSQFSETGVPPHKVCFEINETAAIANIKTAAKLMSELGKSGCTFALDDFGSGLSSMAYMNNLPAKYIKIDGRFVKNIVENTVDFSTVKSINEIAHALGKKTIAEFVEDEEVLNKLKEIGVDYAQGYAIGRPLPIKALLVKSLAASAGM